MKQQYLVRYLHITLKDPRMSEFLQEYLTLPDNEARSELFDMIHTRLEHIYDEKYNGRRAQSESD